MYRFRGVLIGFDGKPTVDFDHPRLRNHLEAFASDNVLLFRAYRLRGDSARRLGLPDGAPLPRLDRAGVTYLDPGWEDPPLYDAAVVCELADPDLRRTRKIACGTASTYMVGWYRARGEHAKFRIHFVDLGKRLIDGEWKDVTYWHVDLVRENGAIEDWSKLLGMTPMQR